MSKLTAFQGKAISQLRRVTRLLPTVPSAYGTPSMAMPPSSTAARIFRRTRPSACVPISACGALHYLTQGTGGPRCTGTSSSSRTRPPGESRLKCWRQKMHNWAGYRLYYGSTGTSATPCGMRWWSYALSERALAVHAATPSSSGWRGAGKRRHRSRLVTAVPAPLGRRPLVSPRQAAAVLDTATLRDTGTGREVE
jgi:hypothetical protein